MSRDSKIQALLLLAGVTICTGLLPAMRNLSAKKNTVPWRQEPSADHEASAIQTKAAGFALATMLALGTTPHAATATMTTSETQTAAVFSSTSSHSLALPPVHFPSINTERERLFMTFSSSSVLTALADTYSSAGVVISDINYDGIVPKTESDEYVVVKNTSKNPVDISKHYIYVASSGTQGPTFYFPAGTVLKPGASVRIYTNEVHKETGGYSFGIKKAIWSNNGGLAVFKDDNGKKLMEFKYKPGT